MWDKRGKLNAVIIILTMLIMIVLIILIWIVIQIFVSSEPKDSIVEVDSSDLEFFIPANSVVFNESSALKFMLERHYSNVINTDVNVILEDHDNNRFIKRMGFQEGELVDLTPIRVTIPKEEHGLEDIANISIVPIIKNNKGKEIVGEIIYSFNLIEDCIIDSCKVVRNCNELITGVNDETLPRLNLIFIGINYDIELVMNKAETFLDWNQQNKGLFTYEPFKSNKDKFNFWYVDRSIIKEGDKEDWGDDWGFDYVMKNCGLSSWYGYAFVNHLGRSSSGNGPNSSVTLFKGSEGFQEIHETGHLIGHLRDEYIEGMQENPMEYWHEINEYIDNSNLFYDSTLDNDRVVTLKECRDNAQWKEWIGKGCGDEDLVDCIDKYVFHKQYHIWDRDPTDPLAIRLDWDVLDDEFCDYREEKSCTILLNGEVIDPFNPGENFTSVVIENGNYRQETFSRDLLCKTGFGGEIGIGIGDCLYEIDCFPGGEYVHYNIYRPTFNSIMLKRGERFGLYNEHLIQEQIDKYTR